METQRLTLSKVGVTGASGTGLGGGTIAGASLAITRPESLGQRLRIIEKFERVKVRLEVLKGEQSV